MRSPGPVLVTGASGFIGRHLAGALIADGWEVRGLSRSVRPGDDGVAWIRGDLRDDESVRVALTGCRAVVHLACLPLGACAADPIGAHEINTGGTVRLLEAARAAGVERVVFASTGQVYGGQAPLPNAETRPCEPDSAYAASKLAAEAWCEASGRAHGLPVQILRLFNVYGPAADGSPRTTVEAAFLAQIRRGDRPQVRGHPASGRDFVHVDDVVRAFSLALTGPIVPGPVNIGTGHLTTLEALARAVARALGRSCHPEIVPTGDPPIRFQADPARAADRLGFRAEVGLEDGLRRLSVVQ